MFNENEGISNEYLNRDHELLTFLSVTTGYSAEKHIGILHKHSISTDIVCTVCPWTVSGNATFLIDIDIVPCYDLKSNDLGSWASKSTKSFYFKGQFNS